MGHPYDPSVTSLWGDGEHVFRLPLAQLFELQEKCGGGPYAVLRRIVGGDWLVGDLRETIRLGLIGGGMKPTDAARLVEAYFIAPLSDHWPLAARILDATLHAPDDLAKKAVAADETTETDDSTPPQSTAPAASSA